MISGKVFRKEYNLPIKIKHVMDKKCTKCNVLKSLESNFYFRTDTGKHRNYCNNCRSNKKDWGKGTTNICEYEGCKKPFIKKAHNGKYCSQNCASNAHKHKTGKSKTMWTPELLKECIYCGIKFHPEKTVPFKKICDELTCQKMYDAERQKRFRKNSPEKIKEISQRAYSKNRERILERGRKYGKTPRGKEIKLFHVRERRAMMNNVIHSFTKEHWEEKVKQQNDICQNCKKPTVKFEQDHIYPLKKASEDFERTGMKRVYTIEYMQPLCRHCNASKWMH